MRRKNLSADRKFITYFKYQILGLHDLLFLEFNLNDLTSDLRKYSICWQSLKNITNNYFLTFNNLLDCSKRAIKC